MKLDTFNIQGEKVGTIELPELFNTPKDEKLIHKYFLWVQTMIRPVLAHTKTRGEVSGGGKKPWKQKGTGRARVGSSRSPIWRHGGIIFGPRNDRNFETRMPRAARRKAMFSALADKATEKNLVVLDEWIMDAPKTKVAIEMLSNLKIDDKKVLHLSKIFDTNLFKSTDNIKGFDSKTIQAMNIIDVLNHDIILITKDSLEALSDHFTKAL